MYIFVYCFLWPLRCGLPFVPGVYKKDYFQIFKRVAFSLHNFYSLSEGQPTPIAWMLIIATAIDSVGVTTDL